MFSRLCYHWFWNTYDYLGSLLLVTLLPLTIVFVGLFPVMVMGPPWSIAIYLIPCCLLALLVFAALLRFCARAASGEPVRIRDLPHGITCCWGRVLFLSGLIAIATLVSYVNFRIYFSLDISSQSRGVQLFVMILAGLQGWILLLILCFAWPVLCAATADDGPFKFRQTLRQALLAITLTPGLWISFSIIAAAFLILCAWSQVGLILYLPFTTMLAHSAWYLSMKKVQFLAESRQQLGSSATLSEMKKRARDLADEWEAATPRRTFKELVKPWEY